jgi:hypothetical protein
MASIASDEDGFAQLKQESRKQYVRMRSQFHDFNPDFDFKSGAPGEETFTNFVKFLQLEIEFGFNFSLDLLFMSQQHDEAKVQCKAPGFSSPHHVNQRLQL